MAEINDWLRSLGLDQYTDVFAENDIELDVLSELKEQDLKELGLSLGHRKKFLKAIAGLRSEAAPETATETRPMAPPGGERRQVTVIFVDLVGFIMLSGTADPEEIHTILNKFFETSDTLIEDFGGSIDKHIGDNVMAVFGAPIAHDDDPMRAVRAALAVHAAMPALSQEVGHKLAVHIGIASGEVVASQTGSQSHGEYTVTGNSVNLASRLDDMAGPGETFISDEVYHAVARFVDCEVVGDTQVRGIEAPVKVWRVQELATSDTSVPDLPFVGRDAERRQFASVLAACREGSRGHTIHLRGEAGIGKSRLVEEFRAAARVAGFDCHTGLIFDFGAGKGRDAIGGILRGLLDLTASNDADTWQAGAHRALDTGLLDPNDAVFINDMLGLPQPSRRAQMQAGKNRSASARGGMVSGTRQGVARGTSGPGGGPQSGASIPGCLAGGGRGLSL